jgi:hypothetical protein
MSTTSNCNCSDATVCEELPPVVDGSKLLVLSATNCQRTLVPKPGSLVYSDGVGVYYVDGSAGAPLALPNLTSYQQLEGITIPSILAQFAGGVIVSVTPDGDTDGLVLTSLAGEWLLAPIPPQLCFDPDDVLTECCCPLAFAVWVEDDSDPENPLMCLRSFNFCEDATNIEAGSIMSCEPETGCIRKLVGTSGDQVPAWDPGTSTWIPTEISDLVPTPDSVLDVAQFSLSETILPASLSPSISDFVAGTGVGWSLAQSGSIVASASYALPYTHNAIRILNTGWHQVNVTIYGELTAIDNAIDPAGFGWHAQLSVSRNNAAISTVPAPVLVQPASAVGVANVSNFDTLLTFSMTASFAANFTVGDNLDFAVILLGRNTSTTETFLLDETTYTASGTITRIT